MHSSSAIIGAAVALAWYDDPWTGVEVLEDQEKPRAPRRLGGARRSARATPIGAPRAPRAVMLAGGAHPPERRPPLPRA